MTMIMKTIRAIDKALPVKVLAALLDDLSSVLRAHKLEGKN